MSNFPLKLKNQGLDSAGIGRKHLLSNTIKYVKLMVKYHQMTEIQGKVLKTGKKKQQNPVHVI